MKNLIRYVFSGILIFQFTSMNLFAQDKLSGTIKYQEAIKYNFESILNGRENDERVKNWVESLPTVGENVHNLYFTEKTAVFVEDESEKEAQPPGLQRAMYAINMGKPPKPKVKDVYYDLAKNKKVDEVEFLTRFFLVESNMGNKAWKLTNEKKKVLDYTCMGAEISIDGQTIKAWFTPEIPISLGPGEFYGLPGIILAVERNGETAFLATSVDLAPPSADLIVKPSKGDEISQKKFDKIVEEKTKEWEDTRQKGNNAGKR